MDTERIELPDGAWVEIKTVVSRRMRKAFRKAGIASVMGGGSNGAGPIDLSDTEAIKSSIMAHPEKWDLAAVDDAFLLHGAEECGDLPGLPAFCYRKFSASQARAKSSATCRRVAALNICAQSPGLAYSLAYLRAPSSIR